MAQFSIVAVEKAIPAGEKGVRGEKPDLTPYVQQLEALMGAGSDQALKIELEDGDKASTLRSRFKEALASLGRSDLALTFRSTYNGSRRDEETGKRLQPNHIVVALREATAETRAKDVSDEAREAARQKRKNRRASKKNGTTEAAGAETEAVVLA